MNKKTLAIAALALVATSGLASARTIHSPKNEQTVLTAPVVATSPYDAYNSVRDDAAIQAQYSRGDNDMDRYNTNEND